MEERNTQQPLSPSPASYPPPPPSSLPHDPNTTAQSVSLPPLEYGVFHRLGRRVLRRVFSVGFAAADLVKPRFGWIVLVFALLVIIGFQSLLLLRPLFSSSSESVDSRAALIQPSESVELFLEAQARFDAEMMWESFSPMLQESLIDQGMTKDDFAEQAETERASGQRYRDFEYVGGITLDGNRKMYFYAVDIVSQAPENTGIYSFVFTVDRNGKIISLQM